jgi:hypothetical protein
MSKTGGLKRKISKSALARAAFAQILAADGITEPHNVRANVAGEQHASRTPQQCELSRAMPRSINDLEAASDRETAGLIRCFLDRLDVGEGGR